MHRFPQTNLQLYGHLVELGYAEADIASVGRAYELGLKLFPGTYRGSGKPVLAHLVGTAGILVTLRARAALIATGLLHAAYTHGEFGDGSRSISDAKRAHVRAAVGVEIEDLVARYTALRWGRETIPAIGARLDRMTTQECEVLLVRLANELEDHLDLGILYMADAERRLRFMHDALPAAAVMAERLGYPSLAKDLTAAFQEIARAEVSPALRRGDAESFRLPFASHRLRLRLAIGHLIAQDPWR